MDWKKNRLSLALLALIAVSAAAIMAARSRSASSELPEPNVSLPEIDATAVDQLVITRPEKPEVAFAKQGDHWMMTRPVEAVADQDAVQLAIDKIAELQLTGVVSTNPELHERLGLSPALALRAQLSEDDKMVTDLWIGPQKTDGTLVRVEGEDTVVSVRGSIAYPFEKDVHLYRDRVITDVDPKHVVALTMVNGDKTFTFERDAAEGEWRQAEGEAPIEKFDPSRVQSLVAALSRLRATGFDELGSDAANRGLEAPSTRVTLKVAPEKAGDEPRLIELALGGSQEGDQYSLQLAGSEVPYRISQINADQLKADPSQFEKLPPPPPAPAGAMPPHGGGMGGGPGGAQQLPPELMKQLQEQLARQQQQPQQR